LNETVGSAIVVVLVDD